MTLKNGFSNCSVICFISQWMIRSKHGLFVFPPQKTLTRRRHWSIGQSCCSMTSKRSIDWFVWEFSGMKFFSPERTLNQPKPTCVCIRSITNFYYTAPFPFVFFSVLFARFHFKVIRKSHLCWALLLYYNCLIERFHSRGQQLCNFIDFALEKVQLPQDCFRTPTWPTCYCFETPIWRTWRHVKHPITSIFLSPFQISSKITSLVTFSSVR